MVIGNDESTVIFEQIFVFLGHAEVILMILDLSPATNERFHAIRKGAVKIQSSLGIKDMSDDVLDVC